MMATERDTLSKIRTLLAVERNYLAQERTALAEFRTGITLALVSPPVISLLIYLFQSQPIERHPLFDAALYLVFIFLTLIGIWMSITSRAHLRQIRRKTRNLKRRQLDVIQECEAVCQLLEDCT